MSVAVTLAIVASVLNLGSGVLHAGLSRAPGWGRSRVFASIAISAGLYSVFNVILSTDGYSVNAYMLFSRANYLLAHLHVLAWIVYVFGGSEPSLSRMPRWLARICAASLAAGVLFALTGWHITAPLAEVRIDWASSVYHYPSTTAVGDLYGLALLLHLAPPFLAFARAARRGDRGATLHLIGYVVFFACSIDELLVANGVLKFLSLADIGFVAIVTPVSIDLVSRFVADARRLADLSDALEGKVRERTEERDRAEGALLEAERLAALGRLAAGVGHEVNNPLAYVRMSLDRLEAHVRSVDAPPDVREAVADAQDGALRIEKVVEGLRSYSRRTQEMRALDLAEAVRSALKVARHRLRHVADLHTDLSPVPAIRADESRVVQALVNLLVNAAEATDSGRGRIAIRTFESADGEVGVEVADAGRGVPSALLSRIAEPYFTTRASEGGLGLGLFITRGIVDAHGGRLEFESRVGEGTCARMLFPAMPVSPTSPAVEASPIVAAESVLPESTLPESTLPESTLPESTLPAAAASATAGVGATFAEPLPRLLLVDDELVITRLLSKRLGRQWDVTVATSGEEALALVRTQHTFDSVLCDLMMPGMSGIALAAEVDRVDPALRDRMVFLTGGAVSDEAERFLGRADVRWLQKPIDFRALDVSLAPFRLARRTVSPVTLAV